MRALLSTVSIIGLLAGACAAAPAEPQPSPSSSFCRQASVVSDDLAAQASATSSTSVPQVLDHLQQLGDAAPDPAARDHAAALASALRTLAELADADPRGGDRATREKAAELQRDYLESYRALTATIGARCGSGSDDR